MVLPSLFEEQIRREERLAERLTSVGADSSPEASSYFPAAIEYHTGPHGYLDLVARARAAVDIPVIASLNGTTEAGWVDYARLIEQAGASALELNVYRIAPSPSATGASAEADCVGLFKAVRRRVAIPVAVKLHPYFSAFGAPGAPARSRRRGRTGSVQSAVSARYRSRSPALEQPTSRSAVPSEIRLGLLWLSVLAGRLRRASLAASTGVETADEVIKYLLAGADVVMTTSALLRHGPEHVRALVAGLETWLSARGFASAGAIKGLMRHSHSDAEAERARRLYPRLVGLSRSFCAPVTCGRPAHPPGGLRLPRRQITGAIVGGPLAFDNAVSRKPPRAPPTIKNQFPHPFQDIDRIVHAIVAQATAGLSRAASGSTSLATT